MSPEGRDALLDVTRLVSRSWTSRQSSGIDRVCYAYLKHFRPRALAVVQHRGVVRVFDARRSERLFDLLLGPDQEFRRKLVAFAPGALANPVPETRLAGMTYLNTSHTDFDLAAHHDWVARSGVRAVYFIHDLIPVLHPEFTRPHAVKRHLGRVREALRHGGGIVTSSHVVARDLAAFAKSEGLDCETPLVAPIAGETFEGAGDQDGEPFFLAVGTVEPRKNHRLLFDIWRGLASRLGEATPKLVLVGQQGPLTGDILAPLADPALAAHVEWRASCDDAELAQLIASARAMLMPSFAEGFGLPLVEALAMGTPVVANDIPIFREIGQGAALLLDPANPAAWTEAIATMTSTPRPQAKPFDAPTWPAHFARLESWLAPRALKSGAACESSLAA